MERSITVRGRLVSPTRIDLDDALDGLAGEVEVVVRPIGLEKAEQDVFDFLRSLAPGTCSKEDIDDRIAEERGSWGDK